MTRATDVDAPPRMPGVEAVLLLEEERVAIYVEGREMEKSNQEFVLERVREMEEILQSQREELAVM